MKKTMKFVALATLAVFALSCGKEITPVEEQTNSNVENTVKGEPVTLSVSLAPETKITHEYTTNPDTGKKAVKPEWEDGDALTVIFEVGGALVQEEFTIDWSSVSADKMTATFSNASSQIASKDDTFDVYYKGNCYDWSIQDGTLANLPEYLEVTGCKSLASRITLEPKLTYLHFIFDENATTGAGEARTYDYAYVYGNGINIYGTPSTIGSIKITGPFSFNENGKPTTDIDIYVAAQIFDSTSGKTDGLGIKFMNGDLYPGIESYGLTWTPASNYTAGKVYKKDAALNFNNGLVGAEDNTTGYWGAFSDYFAIPKGKQLHMEFVNHTSKGQNYNNWNLAITSDADRATDGYTEYAIIRADNWANVANVNCNYCDYFTDGAWAKDIWGTFKDQMDGATVTIDVNYSATTSKVSALIVATAVDGQKYREIYTTSALSDAAIRTFLTVDMSHLFLKEAFLDDAFESFTISQNLDFSKSYYTNGEAVPFDRSSVTVTATKANGDAANIDPRNVIFSSVPATTGTQNITADFGGLAQKSVSVDVTNGAGITAGVNDCSGFFNWGDGTAPVTVSAGSTSVVKFSLYSGMRYNWNGAIVLVQDNSGAEKLAVRMDNAGWGTKWPVTADSNWDWTVFAAYQNHAEVVLTIANDGTKTDVKFDVTYANGDTHHQYYTGAEIGTADIKYIITTEHSYIVLHD